MLSSGRFAITATLSLHSPIGSGLTSTSIATLASRTRPLTTACIRIVPPDTAIALHRGEGTSVQVGWDSSAAGVKGVSKVVVALRSVSRGRRTVTSLIGRAGVACGTIDTVSISMRAGDGDTLTVNSTGNKSSHLPACSMYGLLPTRARTYIIPLDGGTHRHCVLAP